MSQLCAAYDSPMLCCNIDVSGYQHSVYDDKVMEYIVHGSKNQIESYFKLTLERVC